jgi:quinol monooxygenase YgiN
LLQAHLESDHVQAVLAKAPELFDGNDIVVYTALPGGERVKGSLADHAAG